jgi:hypothetical protein
LLLLLVVEKEGVFLLLLVPFLVCGDGSPRLEVAAAGCWPICILSVRRLAPSAIHFTFFDGPKDGGRTWWTRSAAKTWRERRERSRPSSSFGWLFALHGKKRGKEGGTANVMFAFCSQQSSSQPSIDGAKGLLIRRRRCRSGDGANSDGGWQIGGQRGDGMEVGLALFVVHGHRRGKLTERVDQQAEPANSLEGFGI